MTIKRKLKSRRTRKDARFYVYVYLDPRKPGEYFYEEYKFDHEPIYVGKGSNHRVVGFTPHNKYIKNIRKCLQKQNLKLLIIIKDKLSEDDAFREEVDLIRTIGRKDQNKGPLHNYTDGGEGRSGSSHIMTEESKDLLRSYCGENHHFYGKKHRPDSLQLMSDIKKGDNNPLRRAGGMSMEGRLHVSQGCKGKTVPLKTRIKTSETMKAVWAERKQQGIIIKSEKRRQGIVIIKSEGQKQKEENKRLLDEYRKSLK